MNINNKNEFGVLYFHDENPKYKEMCEMSIASLKRFHPEWSITVVTTKTPATPLWKKVYRALTPWKSHLRYNRANQDTRSIAYKAEVMLNSPYENTLYIDVDTIILKPLDEYKNAILENDVVVCPLPWLVYHKFSEKQPNEWPGVMAGVFLYNRKFIKLYKSIIEEYKDILHIIPTNEQCTASLACYIYSDKLKIAYDKNLQIDVIDAHHHLGDDRYHVSNGVFDIEDIIAKNQYAIFHYNEFKPQYMKVISTYSIK